MRTAGKVPLTSSVVNVVASSVPAAVGSPIIKAPVTNIKDMPAGWLRPTPTGMVGIVKRAGEVNSVVKAGKGA